MSSCRTLLALRPSLLGGLLASGFFLVLANSVAIAETVTVTGVAGLPGIPGEGLEPGGDGGVGGDAVVVVGPTDATNTGTANGGTGGRGGPGGALGGDGGAGGNGGLAQSDAISTPSSGNASAVARSTGGAGGAGGDANTSVGAIVGAGGRGGMALTTADASGAEITTTAGANSTGGRGGNAEAIDVSGADGGNADAYARATSSSSVGFATVTADARATGGSGGSARGVGHRGGDGGSATATAQARNTTAPAGGSVSANVNLQGGRGGAGFDGADGGDGANVFAEDLVTVLEGSDVHLLQKVTGGDGGGSSTAGPIAGTRGRGGNVTSLLRYTLSEGDVRLTSWAIGGAGGQGGSSLASGEATASGNVFVTVVSEAGRSLSSASSPIAGLDGATASLGPVWGESTGGGEVHVFADVVAGWGGGSAVSAGNGANASVVDAIDGATTGLLTLRQIAKAGGTQFVSVPDAANTGGQGGSARSELNRTKSLQQFTLEVFSIAGDSNGHSETGAPLGGGAAVSSVDARNDGGTLDVIYGAEGGSGGDSFVTGVAAGQGGSATSIVRATTSGDGNAIFVAQDTSFQTRGGEGGGIGTFARGIIGGVGGVGTSDITGVAEGDSFVNISAEARGGLGGRGDFEDDGGRGGQGGLAEASALGGNAGSSLVAVDALAIGGSGGETRTSLLTATMGGNGGTGIASATGYSTGGGDVFVRVRARGGKGSSGGATGAAIATASAYAGPEATLPLAPIANNARAISIADALGTSGSVEALARSTGGEIGVTAFRTHAKATASLSFGAEVEARAGRDSPGGVLGSASDAAAYIGKPTTIEGEWGRVGLNFNSSQVDPNTTIRLEAGFENDETKLAPLAGVFVTFLDFAIGAEEFSDVNFRIENEGDVLLDEIFSRSDEAIAFFNMVIDVGALADEFLTQTIDLRFILETQGATQGAQFGMILKVDQIPVPEPGTGILLVTGLIIMSSRRRSLGNPATDPALMQ